MQIVIISRIVCIIICNRNIIIFMMATVVMQQHTTGVYHVYHGTDILTHTSGYVSIIGLSMSAMYVGLRHMI